MEEHSFYINRFSVRDFKVKELLYILVAILPVFLLTNKFIYGPIAAILLLAVVGMVNFFRGTPISIYNFKAMVLITIAGSYFLLSYFISNQTFRNLFSFGFLRYDGGFLFCYIAFFIFAVRFLNYEKALRYYFFALFIVFIFFGILGIFEYINAQHFLNVRLDDNYLGPIFVAQNQAHNATGSVYATVGVAAAAFFLEAKEKTLKIFYGSSFLIIAITLLITKSRGSIAGFLTGIVFIFLLSSRSILRLLRNIGILIAGFAASVFLTGTYQRITQMFSFTDASALNRFNLWEKAIILIKASPIFGVGFARYNDIPWNFDQLPLYKYSSLIKFYNGSRAIFNDTNAHNSYLGFMAETGIIGLILMMVFWIFVFYVFIKAYRVSSDIFEKKVYLSISGSIATLFILAISENYMTAPTLMMLLSVSIALGLGFLNDRRLKL